jgi:hypothetical protein
MSKARGLADLGNVYDDGALSNRNLIINGAMRVSQRNGGASANYTSGQTFYLDRFSAEAQSLTGLGATVQQVSDAPSGFSHSMKTTVTAASSSVAASSMIGADQRIEGYNISALGFGGSSAESFTLSFWVKSSVTGTYCVSFFNGSVSRGYLATYTVNSANTWEYKTITVAGDTSGTWTTTNGIGLGVQFSIGGGSGSEGTTGAWSSTYKTRVSGAVSLNETVNATWQLTGVQLEVGDTATPFEHRSYGQELALCQRFFYHSGGGSTAPDLTLSPAYTHANCMFVDMEDSGIPSGQFAVEMRASPVITGSRAYTYDWGTYRNVTGAYADKRGLWRIIHDGGYTIGRPFWYAFTADAEL